ncbi:protein PHYTOCHROME KINASE SUBSTRATE 4-like [Andrographis paniculata]|uniref:protein PHYTOCHROME KINASE SUBSTRATE 4-like n=1 Tax=Andrographis paniculata TaxID=175694 RepID=UPI0021E969A3|nr:protein PHYTOCHROME KINASE SUBSTRATE 4-like [Andrographis paniculata]
MDSPFKDISFSSYLKPQNDAQNSQGNGSPEEAELSIFDAHKYFSESCNQNGLKMQKQQELPDDVLSIPRLSSVSSIDGYGKNFPTRSFRRTATTSSEASWNSRTGLLATPPTKNSRRNLPADQKNMKNNSAVKKWFLGRTCCCSDKKAVQVKEATVMELEHKGAVVKINTTGNDVIRKEMCSERDQSSKGSSPVIIGFGSAEAPRMQRISASGRPFLDGAISFTFPILNSSIEQHNKPSVIGTFAKPIVNLSKYSQPEVPPAVSGPESKRDCVDGGGDFNPRRVIADDDAGSDASSDLFEIENFSSQTTSYTTCALGEDRASARRFNPAGGTKLVDYERMDVVDAAAAAEEAECYAPSEVSVDWSVATADGGDKTSVGNKSEIRNVAPLLRQQKEPPSGDGDWRKGNSGVVLRGCRHEKAVSVASQPVKCMAVDGGWRKAAAAGR